MNKSASSILISARQPLGNPVKLDALLGKLGSKDRQNIDRHLAAMDAEEDTHHRKLWVRILCTLGTLSPHALQTAGQQAVQFFIADGKYRKQVFALEDPRDGRVLIYTEDVLPAAFKAGLLVAPRSGADPTLYGIKGEPGQSLSIEAMDAANTPNPSPFYKHMLGWNRKALRIILAVGSSPAQIDAAEALCALAARDWAVAVAK